MLNPERETPVVGASQAVRMSRREWTIVLLLVVSVIINYIDRSNLSMSAPVIQRQIAMSPVQMGALLSAFFWTYALLQISGVPGWLTDRFHVGWVLVWGYVLWSGATLATGVSMSYAGLFLARLMLGLGESVAYPCYSRIFAALPQEHRGRANSLIDVGTKLGPATGAFLGGLLLVHLGWRMLFFVLGGGGLLWLVPWLRVMPGSKGGVEAENAAPLASIARLLRIRAAWGAFLGHFCGNYFFYFLLAWLPIYLVKEEGLSIGSMSRLTSVMFLWIAGVTGATGWISDRLIAGGVSPTRVRLTVVVGGLTGASSLVALAFIHGRPAASIAVLAIACTSYGAFSSNHWAIAQTLAGTQMAGRWASLQNGVANLSGIVAPWISGWIMQVNGSSRMAFAMTGGVALVGACCWGLLVRRVEPVQWDAAA